MTGGFICCKLWLGCLSRTPTEVAEFQHLVERDISRGTFDHKPVKGAIPVFSVCNYL